MLPRSHRGDGCGGDAGEVSWRIADDVVAIEIDRIENNGASPTGELHVTMWLTEGADPYTNGWAVGAAVPRLHRRHRHAGSRMDLRGRSLRDRLPSPATRRLLRACLRIGGARPQHVVGPRDLHQQGDGGEEDDHGDIRDDATAIPVPSATEGNLGRPGDRDVFRLRVERPGWLGVTTRGTTDTRGTLTDADGKVVGTDDDEGDDLNFFIGARVAPGDWFIEVRGFDGQVTGRYSLVVVFLPDPIPPRARRALPASGATSTETGATTCCCAIRRPASGSSTRWTGAKGRCAPPA